MSILKSANTLPPPPVRRALRESAGLSQKAIATTLEVSRPTITRWEDGSMAPRGPARAAYARLLAALDTSVVASHREHQHLFSVLRAGIHTAAIAWEGVDPQEFEDLVRTAKTDRCAVSAQVLVRARGGPLVRLAPIGLVVSLTQQLDGGNRIEFEGPLGALLAWDVESDALVGPGALDAVHERLRWLAAHLGIQLPPTRPIVARADLAVDVAFESPMVVSSVLAALIPLRVPRATASSKFAPGTARIESVQWSHRGGIQLRAYDRSTATSQALALSSGPIGVVRLEVQRRPRARKRRALHQLDASVMQADFAERVSNLGHDLLITLRTTERLASRLVERGIDYREAERLIGSNALIECTGALAYPNQRVYDERVRRLHAAGIAPSSLADAPIDVSAVCAAAVDHWTESFAYATVGELDEIAANPFYETDERAIASTRASDQRANLARVRGSHKQPGAARSRVW